MEILTVCARLRVGFTTDWLFDWAPRAAVQKFQRKLLYRFRYHHDGWRFLHDSFRKFASDRTALGDDGHPEVNADARANSHVAALCGKTDDRRIAAEQLYHHHLAFQDDEVLRLAEQKVFREQYQELRSPDLIREDIQLALGIAAERANVVVMIRLLLALVELEARSASLETVDMPRLLYEAGLIHEAAVAWTRAAVWFLPTPTVITAIRNQAETPLAADRRDRNLQIEQWESYVHTMKALIGVVGQKGDEPALATIDSALAEDGTKLTDALTRALADADRWGADELNHFIAAVVDLRMSTRTGMISLATTPETVEYHIDYMLLMFGKLRGQASTMLDAAEILARHGRVDRAKEMLSQIPYSRALTVGELGNYDGSAALYLRFWNWRLRHRLASKNDDVAESVPPSIATPAGDDIALSAPVHSDRDAIDLVARVDAAIRKLGQLDAAVA